MSIVNIVHAQFCADTCPPLVNNEPIESLCEGDTPPDSILSKQYTICTNPNSAKLPSSTSTTSSSSSRQAKSQNTFSIQDFAEKGHITVIANFYIGCNAGRRESGIFAHVAQRYYNEYGDKIMFINSLKGGASCNQWAQIYQDDAASLYPDSDIVPEEMPWTVNDIDFQIRDDFFTTPFGHPSYVILDENLKIRKKFIGPCCGYEDFFACTADIAMALDEKLSTIIDELIEEQETPTIDEDAIVTIPSSPPTSIDSCEVSDWSDWSPCSLKCGKDKGIQFRYRAVTANNAEVTCPKPVETRECLPPRLQCQDPKCLVTRGIPCIPEFGTSFTIQTIATDLNNPRDVAFHPTPGLHLSDYSEGRTFFPNEGDEAWVLNGGNHSISIVASLGTETQTTISRRDRGYYHYMIEATALSFNSVSDSGRAPDKDSFNYWAVCNDNRNTYLETKEPNFFMGPTLYNSQPDNSNTVNRLGEPCEKEEPCFFLHADMLHESPACIGITHDPETATAFGNVYWAFDSTGNNQNGQLVRFDFQQPHGPGSMDHSVASVRRYPEVKLTRGPAGVHAGMVVHPERRELFISNPGDNTVIMMKPDSGTFARTAREEYPIYSNRLPSFEYSIYECVDQTVFASDIQMPSGLALSPDGERLFIAEHQSGKIHVYEISSAVLLKTIETGFTSIGGLDFSPSTGQLHFVDANTNTLNAVVTDLTCGSTTYESRTSETFVLAANMAASDLESAGAGSDAFSLIRDYQCKVDPIIPDAAFFDQVHNDTGYASNDTDVQNMAGMDAEAALLANRTDCEWDSELNFDALLLGGYFCHLCLPDASCDFGGTCTNVQWEGYICDNEFYVHVDETTNSITLHRSDGQEIDPSSIMLSFGTTYRFTIKSDIQVSIHETNVVGSDAISLPGNECGCATQGPLLVTPTPPMTDSVYLHSSTGAVMEIQLHMTSSVLSRMSSSADTVEKHTMMSFLTIVLSFIALNNLLL